MYLNINQSINQGAVPDLRAWSDSSP